MSDLVGKKLKDFYVLRRLGRGAMAEVYLAQQLSLGRQVALKVLNAELALDPSYVRRFHHEARAAAALVHGGIVQIYEVGEHNGTHYIAQEYVAGRNLGELIRSHGSLAPQVAVDILRQVAAALVKASSEGIVHRDIKPENIMVAAASGDVKVADFGLARVERGHPLSGGGLDLTQIGITMGTPLYMSPEQIEGREIDSRSDIYSLGVTAYHMLSGEPPFTGNSAIAVAVQHLNQPVPPLDKRVTGGPPVPQRLAQAVERMMAKRPDDRYGEPAELLAELNALAAELSRERGAGTEGPGAPTSSARPTAPSSLAEILQAADQRALATDRLDSVLRTMAVAKPPRWSKRWLAAAVAACALTGALLGALGRRDSLWADVHIGPPQSDDIWGQLYHAKTVDTEEAWRAVERYFPDAGSYYHNLAKQGLVYYYLTRTANYEQALRPLEEFAGSSQPILQAFGAAGLVVAYTRLGEDEQAYLANQQLSTEMRGMLDDQAPRMAGLLNESLDDLADRAL